MELPSTSPQPESHAEVLVSSCMSLQLRLGLLGVIATGCAPNSRAKCRDQGNIPPLIIQTGIDSHEIA